MGKSLKFVQNIVELQREYATKLSLLASTEIEVRCYDDTPKGFSLSLVRLPTKLQVSMFAEDSGLIDLRGLGEIVPTAVPQERHSRPQGCVHSHISHVFEVSRRLILANRHLRACILRTTAPRIVCTNGGV